MSVWSGKRIAECIIDGKIIKINPNGIDVGVSEIRKIPSDEKTSIILHKGIRGYQYDTRESICKKNPVHVDPYEHKVKIEPINDFYMLESGVYEVRIANKVRIPRGAVGLCFPRSTFNRLGIIKCETALWDQGYEGEGTQTLFFPLKAMIHVDEAWFQFIIIDAEESFFYHGSYMGEKKT